MKPFVLMNGRPLIHHALQHAHAWGVQEITIVASPGNVQHLVTICQNTYQYVIQPHPLGVLDALSRSIRNVQHEWVLILCADNVFSDPPELVTGPGFGARELYDADQWKRFTRYRCSEGVTFMIEASEPDPGQGCWIGPLLLETTRVRTFLPQCETIAQLIFKASNDGTQLLPWPMQCSDLGTPEAIWYGIE